MAFTGRFTHLVIDCADPDALSRFWSQLLGVEVASRWNQYVILEPHNGDAPALTFQQVPEAKTVKNRVHLDFQVDDLAASTTAVIDLGGSHLEDHTEGPVTARIMADPEGNELCLVHLGGE